MFYLQVQPNGIITDCIDYPYEDYVPYDGVFIEPIHGGWYKYMSGEIIECPELKPTEDPVDVL
jgi:hypothetical protein